MTVTMGLLAVAIGVSLGMLGAGGAIVAVPAMVYLDGIDAPLAGGYALFIVTVASSVVSIPSIRNGLIRWDAVTLFGLPASLVVIGMRSLVQPLIPKHFGGSLDRQDVLMFLFGIVLITAGSAMLRHTTEARPPSTAAPWKLVMLGSGVGVLTGLLGVGGGFLITPALVIWAGMDMRMAIATSLVLIAINGAVAVTGDIIAGMTYDWSYVLTFTILTTAGILGGARLGKRISVPTLKAAFGWLVMLLGVATLLQEILVAD
ncbi:MAG: sulfite exporter TauE/SafE family protein [Candidatus Kapabacteria bacterium]|jgi:hypothetical protein|nr:sulfite exporter TauE/SafE family protein [Candidatus Kapabacteria bacterium]